MSESVSAELRSFDHDEMGRRQVEIAKAAACDCNRAMMAALSPLHPFHYIELACDEHRREFQQASLADSIRDYEPHNLWRTP